MHWTGQVGDDEMIILDILWLIEGMIKSRWRGVSLKLDFINEVLKYHKEDIKKEIEKYYTPN